MLCVVPLCLRCPHTLEWPVIPVPEGVFPAWQPARRVYIHACVRAYEQRAGIVLTYCV